MLGTLKVGSLFSGAGAFEQALQKNGIKYELLFACDNDKFVKKTFLANYPIKSINWYDNIENLNAKKYKYKVDLIVGGSPCQSFSISGKRLGLEDTRGTLFYEFARVISECKPKYFIFENVMGLLSHDNGKTWRAVLSVLSDLNYSIFHSVLNSKDFGLPQNRKRVFVVGIRGKNKNFTFPQGISTKKDLNSFLDKKLDYKYFLSNKGKSFVYSEYRLKKKYTQINGSISLCQKANQQSNLHGDFIDYSKIYNNQNKFYNNIISIQNKHLSKNKSLDVNYKFLDLVISYPSLNKISKHNFIRRLTPRECFRLMGFSDEFKIVISDQQAYKQSGNSIAVPILSHIIKSLDLN